MRALEPHTAALAYSPHDGTALHYEVFGPRGAARTVVCLPTWSLVHGRVWKMQVPYLAHLGYRVVTMDGRGNGRSGRPASGYSTRDFAADAVAVMDAAGVDRAALLAISAGGRWAAVLAVEHAPRVESVTFIAPSAYLASGLRALGTPFTEAPPDREGWNKYNAVHWREDLADFRRWFAGQVFTEPHSTKGQDDIVAWSEGISPDMLVATVMESAMPWMRDLWPRMRQPLLFVHGTDDAVTPLANTLELVSHLPHAELVVLEGSGHAPHLRDPVRFNLLLRGFLERNDPHGARGPREEVEAHASA